MLKFNRDSYQWKECGSFQLQCNGGVVTKAVMNGCGQIVYLVEEQCESDWCNSVYVDTLTRG